MLIILDYIVLSDNAPLSLLGPYNEESKTKHVSMGSQVYCGKEARHHHFFESRACSRTKGKLVPSEHLRKCCGLPTRDVAYVGTGLSFALNTEGMLLRSVRPAGYPGPFFGAIFVLCVGELWR